MTEQFWLAIFYDVQGQISFKLLSVEVEQMPLQRIDYAYNIRGWLKTIKDVTKDMSTAQSESNPDLFAFKINYNTAEDVLNYTITPLLKGKIAETIGALPQTIYLESMVTNITI